MTRVTRYAYACADGRPRFYLDEDGGPSVMGYALDGRWAFYFDYDRRNVYAPNGKPLFYLADNYLCDATGPVLYLDKEEEEEDPLGGDMPDLDLTDVQWKIVHDVIEAVHPTKWLAYLRRVGALLPEADLNDDIVRSACLQAVNEI